MNKPKLFAALLLSSIAAVACAAPTTADEETGTTAEALDNASDPLLGSVCRACGCDYVARTDSTTGCTVYRCECDSTAKAECVVKAPGGTAAVISDPTPPPPPRRAIYTAPKTTAVFSP
jgi:hypothetical protein